MRTSPADLPAGRRNPAIFAIAFALVVSTIATTCLAGRGHYYRCWYPPQILEYAENQLFLEENATDGDLGIHFKVDGEPWDKFVLYTPRWRKLVEVKVRGSSGVIGLTELFNESAEPSFDEVPREDFLALFPEGEYKFFGRTVEGDWLFGLADLTHVMPQQPVILAPEEEAVVDANEPFVVEWEPVPNPPGSEIVRVQVVVEKDEDDAYPRVLAADMEPEDTELTVAPGFLEEGTAYKVEILAEEASGNKIITEVEFETAE